MAQEEVKVRQLMNMSFLYIDKDDCHRALSHCQGKIKRATMWLMDQSETIASRTLGTFITKEFVFSLAAYMNLVLLFLSHSPLLVVTTLHVAQNHFFAVKIWCVCELSNQIFRRNFCQGPAEQN